jgi:hypothetical protein
MMLYTVVSKITSSILFMELDTNWVVYFIVLAADYFVTSVFMLCVMCFSLKGIKKMTTDCPELESNENNFKLL